MKLGIVADIHGNAAALSAVLADAEPHAVEAWWALGDLVLFGPRPVEVLDMLAGLPGIAYVSGNTDRYVLTGEQPHPHRTIADAVGDRGLVERFVGMAGAIGWTRGALCQAECLDLLTTLPAHQRTVLPDGSALLGLHASLRRDDGAGIDSTSSDDALAKVIDGCEADIVVGGHTHDPTDRVVAGVRALNPGSVGIPRRTGEASWLLVEADGSGVHIEHRSAAFDVDAVVSDLYGRGYPNAPFLESVLTGRRASMA